MLVVETIGPRYAGQYFIPLVSRSRRSARELRLIAQGWCVKVIRSNAGCEFHYERSRATASRDWALATAENSIGCWRRTRSKAARRSG